MAKPRHNGGLLATAGIGKMPAKVVQIDRSCLDCGSGRRGPWARLITRCAGLSTHPANDIEHKITQTVRSFGANDFAPEKCCFSPASSQEVRKRSAAATVAMPMISD